MLIQCTVCLEHFYSSMEFSNWYHTGHLAHGGIALVPDASVAPTSHEQDIRAIHSINISRLAKQKEMRFVRRYSLALVLLNDHSLSEGDQ